MDDFQKRAKEIINKTIATSDLPDKPVVIDKMRKITPVVPANFESKFFNFKIMPIKKSLEILYVVDG